MASYSTSVASGEVKIRMGEGVNAIEPITVPHLFKTTAAKFADRVALRYQVNDVWTTVSWKEYYERSRRFGKSLISLGLKPFQAINIIGFNSPEWFQAHCGVILAGGLSAGVYTTNGPEACEYISNHSEAIVVVVDGVEQLKKYVEIAGSLPHLKAIVLYNGTVPDDVTSSVPIHTFEDFLKVGDSVADADLEERMNSVKPGNCCMLIYTSGTTGPPKAVMISHDNAIWTAKVVIQLLGDINENDRLVSYLPLSHVAAQMLDIFAPLCAGFVISFARPDALKGSLASTLKEVKPTVFFGVPRVWEKIAEKMWKLGSGITGFKKRIATWAKEKGAQKNRLAQYGNTGGVPCGFPCAHKIVLSKIKAALGLDECRCCFTGAAPISLEVLEYFSSLDIPIYELFGQSECTGPQTINIPGKWKTGTCGTKLPGTEMKIVESNGEIIFCGRNVMMGYLKMDEATKSSFTEDGWLLSGDVAKIDDDGFMTITGRIKELIITAGGENIPPVLIEDAMKLEMKALSNTMVVGDTKKYLTILFCLREKLDDGQVTGELDDIAIEELKAAGSSATTVAEAQKCEKVSAYLTKGMKAVNEKSASRAQRIAKWALLKQDFTIPGDELTPTLKLKRRVVLEKYADVIDSLYAEQEPATTTEPVVDAKIEKVKENTI